MRSRDLQPQNPQASVGLNLDCLYICHRVRSLPSVGPPMLCALFLEEPVHRRLSRAQERQRHVRGQERQGIFESLG